MKESSPQDEGLELQPRGRPRGAWLRKLRLIGLCTLVLGCASQSESTMKRHFSERESFRSEAKSAPAPPTFATATSGPDAGQAAKPLDRHGTSPGGLGTYVAAAMKESPALRAAFDRWSASVHRTSRARALPGPTLSFGYFVSSVETRVGPQRARIGLSQMFPWPTRLTASADAASANARAAESQFDALALGVQNRVAAAYYQLWLIRQLRKIHAEHLEVLRSLSETILARVATGATTLADQQQVDLSAARLEDMLAGMDEDEISAKARLRATIGTREANDFPTTEAPPDARLPAATEESLAAAALGHPFLESYEHRATAQEETARALDAEGLPSFTIGADWIITGRARMPDVEDSGKDAVMVGGGISLPLWGGYGQNAEAARAEARASRSERVAMEDRAIAELQTKLSEVRDAVRRIRLYEHTLVPQADSAYASVLGSYVAGRGTVAQALLAQKELLELRGELERSRTDYAIAWAGLEEVVGRSVESSPPATDELGTVDSLTPETTETQTDEPATDEQNVGEGETPKEEKAE